MEKIYHEEILTFALDFGKKLLESGYEVLKTQRTMEILCKNFGATDTEFFVIPSEINTTVKFNDDTYTQMREITKGGTNLFIIEKLNDLSRRICKEKLSLYESKELFNKVILQKPYGQLINSLGAGLGTGGFSVFFGGTLADGICAFVIGFLAFYIYNFFIEHFSKIAVAFLVSAIDGIIAVLLYKLGLCNNLDMVMIGAIMTIIPGMAFGNSVKDLLVGDTISGILTFTNAILISVAIASGLASVIAMFLNNFINITTAVTSDFARVISGMVGTIGFGLLFSLHPKKLPTIAIGGAVVTFVLVIAEQIVPSGRFFVFFTEMIASIFAEILSEILARVQKAPTAIFLLPFLIPLVPGGGLYRTMFNLVKGDYTLFNVYFSSTIESGLGIAVGMVFAGIFFRIIYYCYAQIKKRFTEKK